MKLIKSMMIIALLLIVFPFSVVSSQSVSFEQTSSFFPDNEILQQDSIRWGYLKVPENWEDTHSSTIKIAVAELKNLSNRSDANGVVFIQGGPGAGGISNIWMWRRHPLREKNNIILIDIRGTGFSEPRLCPELGGEFLEILAKNQSEAQDEEQKTSAALMCKQNLLSKSINIKAYNSLSVSKDLNALKSLLDYRNWHIYGVSYGTHMAQVYASNFPGDVKTLTLDSFIPEISDYYTQNTSNYIHALSKIFELCRNDPDCNLNYPDLEQVYYQNIADLEKNPITVSVDKKVLKSGEFTYNSEDYKVAIQQALYQKRLVEVVPLLVYEFRNRNKDALGNLVAAFSSLLEMDYGVYYCVSCNEVLPNNKLSQYQEDAQKYAKLDGGISFYKSDFKVCNQWNLNRTDSSIIYNNIAKLENAPFPILIFSGEYDPITPASSVEKIIKNLNTANAVKGYTYGHVPGFTRTGSLVASSFIDNPQQKPNSDAYKNERKLSFVNNITMNKGISKMGDTLNQLNLIFLSPLFIALTIMLGFIFIYLVKLIKRKYVTNQDKIVRIFSIITSAVGLAGLIFLVLAMIRVLNQNYFILAFGLPSNFSYIFAILQCFVIFFLLMLIYFIFHIKKIKDRSIVFSILFSNIVLITYLFYWGIIF